MWDWDANHGESELDMGVNRSSDNSKFAQQKIEIITPMETLLIFIFLLHSENNLFQFNNIL